MLIRLIALCLIGLTALFGPSVQEAAAQKKVALVIGIDDYQTVPKLQRAVEDARSVDAALRELGFSVHRIENSNRMAISLALAAFQSQIEKGDTAFVFFAGHGVEIKGQNLLLPADVPEPNSASEGLLKDMGFFTADLIERVTERGARAAFFVIDACRNNPYAQPGSRRSIGTTRGLAKMEAPEGVFVLLSAGLGQEALDTLNTRDAPQRDAAKNSVFTRVFLEEFRRPGVTHTEMAKNVQVRVRDLAREVGHSQVPAFTDQILGWVVFREDQASTNIERRPPASIGPPALINPTASISPPAPINPTASISPTAPVN